MILVCFGGEIRFEQPGKEKVEVVNGGDLSSKLQLGKKDSLEVKLRKEKEEKGITPVITDR